MSYTPATLATLAGLWKSKGGTFLGVVGSLTTHCGGYHLGRDRIFGPCACKPGGTCRAGLGASDYSVHDNPSRDGAHCTNAAMAIDLGPISGHAGSEVSLAKWLIAECRASAPDTLDIRAVNYETMRWDRERGVSSLPYIHAVNETGHAHIEWYRDSENRPKTGAVSRFLAAYLPVPRTIACSGGQLWSGPSKDSTAIMALAQGDVVLTHAAVSGGAWSFSCNGSKSGTAWYPVVSVNGAAHVGFVAVGRCTG